MLELGVVVEDNDRIGGSGRGKRELELGVEERELELGVVVEERVLELGVEEREC